MPRRKGTPPPSSGLADQSCQMSARLDESPGAGGRPYRRSGRRGAPSSGGRLPIRPATRCDVRRGGNHAPRRRLIVRSAIRNPARVAATRAVVAAGIQFSSVCLSSLLAWRRTAPIRCSSFIASGFHPQHPCDGGGAAEPKAPLPARTGAGRVSSRSRSPNRNRSSNRNRSWPRCRPRTPTSAAPRLPIGRVDPATAAPTCATRTRRPRIPERGDDEDPERPSPRSRPSHRPSG